MFGRYEYINENENSKKFWCIKQIGDGMVEVSWGRIGTAGQSQTVDEMTAIKRRNEKLAKGYRLVGSNQPEVEVFKVKKSGKKVSSNQDEAPTEFLRWVRGLEK